jgi:hypothetical protein
VYEPAVASVTLVLPLAASEPDQPSPVVPPLAVQLLVSVEFQMSVKDWPAGLEIQALQRSDMKMRHQQTKRI